MKIIHLKPSNGSIARVSLAINRQKKRCEHTAREFIVIAFPGCVERGLRPHTYTHNITFVPISTMTESFQPLRI
jgi:hypothetical protein